jgi:hypothetical protein
MLTDEELARHNYEYMLDRLGRDVFVPWEELHPTVRAEIIRAIARIREIGLDWRNRQCG